MQHSPCLHCPSTNYRFMSPVILPAKISDLRTPLTIVTPFHSSKSAFQMHPTLDINRPRVYTVTMYLNPDWSVNALATTRGRKHAAEDPSCTNKPRENEIYLGLQNHLH